mmetsp:Transcript_5850/g.6599  ORF Transcript_5850/g.6599 Transcript_5850/m.6599 type:complete len:176 (+) Transcript_5850:802-1329(+)
MCNSVYTIDKFVVGVSRHVNGIDPIFSPGMITSARSASSHRTLPLEHLPSCLAQHATSKISYVTLPDGITSHHFTHRIRGVVGSNEPKFHREREREAISGVFHTMVLYVRDGIFGTSRRRSTISHHSKAQHLHTRETEEHRMYGWVHDREATNERTSIASSVDRDIPSGERIELN